MREILFRGKSLRTGKWIQGYLFSCWERAYIAWGMVNDNADMKEVAPETVCQYTGLTDKNGRKIFEGDCLGHKENIVEYLCGEFAVNGDRPLSMMAKYNEVVGNVFDKE